MLWDWDTWLLYTLSAASTKESKETLPLAWLGRFLRWSNGKLILGLPSCNRLHKGLRPSGLRFWQKHFSPEQETGDVRSFKQPYDKQDCSVCSPGSPANPRCDLDIGPTKNILRTGCTRQTRQTRSSIALGSKGTTSPIQRAHHHRVAQCWGKTSWIPTLQAQISPVFSVQFISFLKQIQTASIRQLKNIQTASIQASSCFHSIPDSHMVT